MITRVFPIAVALAIAVGVLAELAFTKSRVMPIRDALTDSDTAVVCIGGQVSRTERNVFVLRDSTGSVELQTCPKWYRNVQLDSNIPAVVSGEIIRNRTPLKGTLYTLAAHKISQRGRPDIVIRTSVGKPPWASRVCVPR